MSGITETIIVIASFVVGFCVVFFIMERSKRG
jgi:hypothetical protein